MKFFNQSIKKYYSFVESKLFHTTGIKIIKGPFKDIIYTYGKCALKEQNGKLVTRYEYTIRESPYENINIKKFEKLVGDILIDVIMDRMNSDNFSELYEDEEDVVPLDDRGLDFEGDD